MIFLAIFLLYTLLLILVYLRKNGIGRVFLLFLILLFLSLSLIHCYARPVDDPHLQTLIAILLLLPFIVIVYLLVE